MPQQSCPWCGHCGPRYDEGTPTAERPRPHDDGSDCICRHVTCSSRFAALRDAGRYWDGSAWVCLSCGTAPSVTDEEAAARAASLNPNGDDAMLLRDIEAMAGRVAESLSRLYPDYPWHIEPEAASVLGTVHIGMGPDLHDAGSKHIGVDVSEYPSLTDAEADLLLTGLEYLSGREWRDPEVMTAIAGLSDS